MPRAAAAGLAPSRRRPCAGAHSSILAAQYTEDAQQTIRRQQDGLEKLQKENEQLKSEMSMETRHMSAKQTSGALTMLTSLQVRVAQRGVFQLQ